MGAAGTIHETVMLFWPETTTRTCSGMFVTVVIEKIEGVSEDVLYIVNKRNMHTLITMSIDKIIIKTNAVTYVIHSLLSDLWQLARSYTFNSVII